jgi:broad specificity phosphatase PhoE
MSNPTASNPFSSKSNVAEIFLIRHADALPDEEEVLPGGNYDQQPLSAKGRAQSVALAQRWGSIRFDAIYSSPLRRTLETATPLSERQGLEIIVRGDLREINLGAQFKIPEGELSAKETAEALRERLDRIVQLAAIHGSWDAVNAAEASTDFRKRVITALDLIAQEHQGQRVAVFSHGGAINIFIAEVLGISRDFFFPCGNTSVSIIRIASNGFEGRPGPIRVLVSLNELSHLRDASLLKD